MPTQNGICGASSHQLLSVGDVCRLSGAHPNTVRRWSLNQLPTYRSGNGGHRRFKREDVEEFLGLEVESEHPSILLYCRVSSGGQAKGFKKNEESSLSRQVERLKLHCQNQYGLAPTVFTDIGSGLSFKRAGLIRMLEQIMQHKHDGGILLLTFRDRLARFGVEIIELLAKNHGIKIIYTEKELNESEEKELSDDIIAVCTSFSARIHGARAAKLSTKTMSQEAIERATELKQQGVSTTKVVAIMNEEGFELSDGSPVSMAIVNKYTKKPLDLILPKQTKNNVQEYLDECIEVTTNDTRIKSHDIYLDYSEWCKSKGKDVLPIMSLGRVLIKQFRKTGVIDPELKKQGNYKIHAGWMGIRVKNKKLHFQVKSKPHKKHVKQEEQPAENFVVFYDEVLKGRFNGFRRELDEKYKQWCKEKGFKPINRNKIPKLIRMISNQHGQKEKFGMRYNFLDIAKGK
ncbi:IS607 family transposase [Bythopirellula polymerisocia]|uniref:Resolvase/invertase-type recombinase catalytic domain-containing protein n=1 Tax=Bythopirellula polymerisocia TaxID=2528003 RepID=A0A5C6CTB9_9BACT|nr:IS607 family transposase [Bythopirellula polymerisocia]TWU27840.1 hypothetical protein Pla144_26170 [Bythopirellula polymerisocia]